MTPEHLSSLLLILMLMLLQCAHSTDPATEGKNSAAAGDTASAMKVASAKLTIIRDFVEAHGDAIRASRRQADLFDGSGYMIDLLEELTEFETRADEHRSRERRSAPTSDGPLAAPTHAFTSLEEALAHLNGGAQAEPVTAEFKLRFVKQPNAAEQQRSRSRRKRSNTNWQKTTDKEDDEDRNAEAEASMARLDENLQELARHLEEQRADETHQYGQAAEAMAKFNSRIGDAYNSLVRLRATVGSEQPHQPPRMRHLFKEGSAKWVLEPDALRENVKQLEKIYRQMDEL